MLIQKLIHAETCSVSYPIMTYVDTQLIQETGMQFFDPCSISDINIQYASCKSTAMLFMLITGEI